MLVDVPCTGTGTRRRNPDGRWTLSPQDLAELVPKQAAILDAAARLVKPGGGLVYATCSVLPAEDERQIEDFVERHPEFHRRAGRRPRHAARDGVRAVPARLSPLKHGTDGFFGAALVRQGRARRLDPPDRGPGLIASLPITSPMITIRRARKSDATAIGRVYVETWQATYALACCPNSMLVRMSDVRQTAWWLRAIDDSRGIARHLFVADDEDMGVTGFGSCGPVREIPEGLDGTETRVGEVYTLYVEPDFQNQGMGRRLLDAMFRQLQADGCDTVILWMLANNPSRFFYEGLGGAVVGRRLDRMSGTEVEEVAYAWRDLDAPLGGGGDPPQARARGRGLESQPRSRCAQPLDQPDADGISIGEPVSPGIQRHPSAQPLAALRRASTRPSS